MQVREKEELVAKKKEELDVEQLRVVWQSIQGACFKSSHKDIQMTKVYQLHKLKYGMPELIEGCLSSFYFLWSLY